MRIWHVLALAAVAMLLPSATLKAQEAVKVGVCNPAKVFEQMDERKVIEDKMKSERDKATAEVQRPQETKWRTFSGSATSCAPKAPSSRKRPTR